MTTGGNAFYEGEAASSETTLTLGVGDLSAQDGPGTITYGLTNLEGDGDIKITLDLDRRADMEQKARGEQEKDKDSVYKTGTRTTMPDSAKEIGKHETAHAIDARKDPTGHRQRSAASKTINDRDKKPSEIERKKIQNTEVRKNSGKFKDKKAAEKRFKEIIKYTQYKTVSN